MSQGAQKVHAVVKVKAPGQTRIIVLDTQDLSVGRSNENDLAIDDPEMSRRHMVFRRTPEGFRVEDMGTSNGTAVNGECVDHALLSHGDKVRVGEVEIVFAQTSKNPASLGPSVEFASQLKSFGSPMQGHSGDDEATILGLMDVAGEPGDVVDFQVQSAGDFDLDLNAEGPPGSRARNLDDEVADLVSDPDDEFDFAQLSAPTAPTAPDEPDPVWELDDGDLAEAQPADPAKPAPVAAPSASRSGRLALTLEIEGAEGELRTLLEGLAGKVLEVPSLRVRVKSEDLD